MSVTQYIGARYVPLFAEPDQWSSERAYEPLTIVLHEGNSYTSKQAVPIGIDILNTEFWACTGNYNAQVEAYRREVQEFAGDIEAAQQTADEAKEAVELETTARETADADLQTAIDDEAAARETAINNEVEAREAADEDLQTAIDAVDFKNIAKSFYIVPEYIGSFTNYNGLYKSANGNTNEPMFPQAFCTESDTSFLYAINNSNDSEAFFVRVDLNNNTVTKLQPRYNNLGHANSMCYNPNNRKYYLNDGSKHIIVLDSNLTVETTLNTPDDSNFSEMVFDKATGKMWLVSYSWNVFEFNPETNEFNDCGYALNPSVTSGGNLGQGGAIYNNVLVMPVGKNANGNGLRVYNILDGSLICDFSMPADNGMYPIGEIEDVDFTSSGDLYLNTSASVRHSDEFCRTSITFKCNIFTGDIATYDYTYPTETEQIYVECEEYDGFFSNGTTNYPLKSLDELSLLASAMKNIRFVNMGVNSAYSSTARQYWFGDIILSGLQIGMIFNGANNIVIMGRIRLQNNVVLTLRNRYSFTPMFNQSGANAITGANAIILANSIVYVPTSESGSNGDCQTVVQLAGTSMFRAVNVTGLEAGATTAVSGINGGYGYYIGQLEATGSLS